MVHEINLQHSSADQPLHVRLTSTTKFLHVAIFPAQRLIFHYYSITTIIALWDYFSVKISYGYFEPGVNLAN